MDSLLWGPIYFLRDPVPSNRVFGAVAFIVLGLGIVSVLAKRNIVTVVLAIVSVLLWVFLGLIGRATGA